MSSDFVICLFCHKSVNLILLGFDVIVIVSINIIVKQLGARVNWELDKGFYCNVSSIFSIFLV